MTFVFFCMVNILLQAEDIHKTNEKTSSQHKFFYELQKKVKAQFFLFIIGARIKQTLLDF